MANQRRYLAFGMFLLLFASTPDLQADMEQAQQALDKEGYEEVRDLYRQRSGYAARFGEGVACYRLKDYACAQNNFASAAWQATDRLQRGTAIFNLANSHFFSGNLKQATILYREAGLLGVNEVQVRINLSFAESLAKSVEQHIQNLRKIKASAEWRSQASELPENLVEQLADGIYLEPPEEVAIILKALSPQQAKELLTASIQSMSNPNAGSSAQYEPRWIQSETSAQAGSTADLLNILMSMEIGLPNAGVHEPYRIEGQRPW